MKLIVVMRVGVLVARDADAVRAEADGDKPIRIVPADGLAHGEALAQAVGDLGQPREDVDAREPTAGRIQEGRRHVVVRPPL